MHLAYIVTFVHPLQIVVLLWTVQSCTVLYTVCNGAVSLFLTVHSMPAPVCQLSYYTTELFKTMSCNIKKKKFGLKLNIQKTNIMASGHITSWEIDGETVETVANLIFLGSKITADGDCSHEIKRCLLLGRKVMTNLHSIFKSRDITLPTKVHLVKAMVFPVVMYGCESWTVKKAERRRPDAFELWCWRGLLRVP